MWLKIVLSNWKIPSYHGGGPSRSCKIFFFHKIILHSHFRKGCFELFPVAIEAHRERIEFHNAQDGLYRVMMDPCLSPDREDFELKHAA